MVTHRDLTGRVSNQASDKWGRWVSQDLQGNNGRKIAVFSCYQVIYKQTQLGCTTAASQQHNLLLRQKDPLTDPRRAFKRDLHEALREKRSQGMELLLLGDFNEVFGSDPQGISNLAMQLDLQHIMSTQHPTPLPATYARGRKCIDYALATPEVARSVMYVGFEAFNARIQSDHHAYFIDFKTSTLFGSETQSLSKRVPRMLQTKNIAQTTAYLREKYRIMENHNAFARAETLTLPGDRHTFAERLDKDLREASLAAEKTLKHYGEPAWSVTLAQARKKCKYLLQVLSAMRTGLALPVTTVQGLHRFDSNITLPLTQSACSQMLRQAVKDVKHLVAASYSRRDEERVLQLKQLDSSSNPLDRHKARDIRRIKKRKTSNRYFAN